MAWKDHGLSLLQNIGPSCEAHPAASLGWSLPAHSNETPLLIKRRKSHLTSENCGGDQSVYYNQTLRRVLGL